MSIIKQMMRHLCWGWWNPRDWLGVWGWPSEKEEGKVTTLSVWRKNSHLADGSRQVSCAEQVCIHFYTISKTEKEKLLSWFGSRRAQGLLQAISCEQPSCEGFFGSCEQAQVEHMHVFSSPSIKAAGPGGWPLLHMVLGLFVPPCYCSLGNLCELC